MRRMAPPEPRPLRLDASRSDALQRAAKLIEQAWASFDHARPEEPPLDDRVRSLLGGDLPEDPRGVDEVLDDAARILDESIDRNGGEPTGVSAVSSASSSSCSVQPSRSARSMCGFTPHMRDWPIIAAIATSSRYFAGNCLPFVGKPSCSRLSPDSRL